MNKLQLYKVGRALGPRFWKVVAEHSASDDRHGRRGARSSLVAQPHSRLSSRGRGPWSCWCRPRPCSCCTATRWSPRGRASTLFAPRLKHARVGGGRGWEHGEMGSLGRSPARRVERCRGICADKSAYLQRRLHVYYPEDHRVYAATTHDVRASGEVIGVTFDEKVGCASQGYAKYYWCTRRPVRVSHATS